MISCVCCLITVIKVNFHVHRDMRVHISNLHMCTRLHKYVSRKTTLDVINQIYIIYIYVSIFVFAYTHIYI